MQVSISELTRLEFACSHTITLSPDGFPRFSALKGASSSTSPAVYLWLAQRAQGAEGEVLYVGKAGKGVVRRCAQHQAGFSNSETGRKNATALKEILSDPAIFVTVMARKATTIELFGQEVSLYAAEEDALCARFTPQLNRAAFPDVAERDGAQTEKPLTNTKAHGSGNLARIATLINGRLRSQDEGTKDDMLGQIEAYSPANLALLERMLEFIEKRLLAPEHALKLVGGYTGQFQRCNGVTTLGFGNLVHKSFAPNGWVARIYLADDAPKMSFPERFLVEAPRYKVEQARGCFSPEDLDTFFEEPSNFIGADHLR